MKIGFPKEKSVKETRVALTPDMVRKWVGLGAEVVVENNFGEHCYYRDDDFQKEGAQIADRQKILMESDIIIRLQKPSIEELKGLKKEVLHISYLDPFNERELVDYLAKAGVSAISMEMIPRLTLAQKMDALSSQASLAGYVAVLLAASHLSKVFPMMMTPAGTLSPSKVFIVGAGVAGLQAIATARRLGARVEAFDTRPVVEEQVKSLGAKFVKIDLGETGQTKDGYAKELTPEQLEKQRQGMKKVCAGSDIVITTAQLFGRQAPRIISKDMVEAMSPGSVLVDLAVESGGNIEGSCLDEVVDMNGVKIIGYSNLPGRVPVHASQMLAGNFFNLVSYFWDKENKTVHLDLTNEILKGCVITHQGNVVNEMLKK